MKRIFLTIVMLCISFTFLKAQSSLKGFFTANYGASSPVGKFASTNPNSEESGYALNGHIFNVSLDILLNKSFGFSSTYLSQTNSFKIETYKQQLEFYNNDKFVNLKSDNWKISGYMIGGIFVHPISPIFDIETKALFGFLNATKPLISKDFNYNIINTSSNGLKSDMTSSSFTFLLCVSTYPPH